MPSDRSFQSPESPAPASYRVWRFAPMVVWMAVIFLLSAQSGGELDTWLPFFRRLLPGLEDFNPMHYAAYFVLALTVAFGLGSRAFSWKGYLRILAVCVLYGATDEWHQAYVPNRTPDWNDLLHDGIGAAAACVLLMIYRLFRKRRSVPTSRKY